MLLFFTGNENIGNDILTWEIFIMDGLLVETYGRGSVLAEGKTKIIR